MRVDRAALKSLNMKLDILPDFSAHKEYLIAGVLSVIWASALLTYGAGYFDLAGTAAEPIRRTFLDIILYGSALVFPLLFVWLGAYMIRQTRVLSEDAAKLKAAVETMENAINLSSPATTGDVVQAINDATSAAMHAEQMRINTQFRNFSEELRQVSASVKQLEKAHGAEHHAITLLVETAQDAAEKAARKATTAEARNSKLSKMTFDAVHDDAGQDALPLEAPSGTRPDDLEWDQVIRAVNFPQDEHDKDGFAAIRRVIGNRDIAQLMQASEDVLSMLAQEGIYMDDLAVSQTNPDLWHKFAAGGRGEIVGELGTIEDQAALALARGRMRNDSIFRDVSLHFLRQFDRFLRGAIHNATDRDLVRLADTRTGRAFQLMARVSGSFD